MRDNKIHRFHSVSVAPYYEAKICISNFVVSYSKLDLIYSVYGIYLRLLYLKSMADKNYIWPVKSYQLKGKMFRNADNINFDRFG